ncbi:MAG: general secretion pathway protein GspK [Planctomycetes bacterium]|nr:general secretion pathway protein GspK [Planctomycetota bacterium]
MSRCQRMPTRRRRPASRRGSVVIIVIWAIAIAAVVASSVQLFSYRQATLGRSALHRVQARWAARAGVENTIAMLGLHTEQPIPDDAFAIVNDMEQVSEYDELFDAMYDIRHHKEGRTLAGPFDEHARININRDDTTALGVLEDMTPDVASAVTDWKDSDSDPNLLGVEADHYQAMTPPYSPRNGPLRSIAEMELIAGIWPEYLRNEDWNMNNRLDPNENDGARSLPEDEPDGILDAGWGGRLTVHSVEGGSTASGLPRLHLRWATSEEVMERTGVSQRQAAVIIAFGKREQNLLEQLISTSITYVNAQGQIAGQGSSPNMEELTPEQVGSILDECTQFPLHERRPGKINLNTAEHELVRDVLVLRQLPEPVIDEILYLRDSRAEGLTSPIDLFDIPDMTPAMVQQVAMNFSTSSNVYTISSRGRSTVSETEVEIIAVVDRSTVPVRILEYREQ